VYTSITSPGWRTATQSKRVRGGLRPKRATLRKRSNAKTIKEGSEVQKNRSQLHSDGVLEAEEWDPHNTRAGACGRPRGRGGGFRKKNRQNENGIDEFQNVSAECHFVVRIDPTDRLSAAGERDGEESRKSGPIEKKKNEESDESTLKRRPRS